MKRLLLYPATLQHLRVIQAAHLVRDRLFRLFGSQLRGDDATLKRTPPLTLRAALKLPPHPRKSADRLEIDIFGVRFDWRKGGGWYEDRRDGLRPETLYYLEFLLRFLPDEADFAADVALDFLRWAPRRPPQFSAYTAARRLIVLCAIAACLPPDSQKRRQLLIAATQHARILFAHTEHHLSANHLLKCAKGLLWAGYFLRHKESARWLAKGRFLWRRVLRRQFLPSGCHYERCCGYHCAVVEDLLDVVAASRAAGDQQIASRTKEVLERALRFLATILHPDGGLPLFGDTAGGLAPQPADILRSAETLGFHPPVAEDGPFVFADAGFYGARFGGDFLVVTAGGTGAPDQPGHAHCDFGSFELSLGGRRVVTDTGVYNYTAGARRDWARSTAAHNVAQPDNLEQGRFWAAHRFAEVSYPRSVRWRYEEKSKKLTLQTVGSVYRRYGLLWIRRLLFQTSRVEITDDISGTNFVCRLHLAPQWRYEDGAIVADGTRLSVEATGPISAERKPLWEHFYGEKQRFCIIVRGRNRIWVRIRRRV